MWVTSGAEVLVPGITDLLKVQINNAFRFAELARTQADMIRQFDVRRQPELCFSVRVSYVYVQSSLLTREEVQSERTFANYCG
jgi:hypothetical protein